MKSRSKAKGRSRLYDFTVIGGGIVGLATAYHLVHAYPQAAVLVLEKEQSLGLHQTGNNSGVIHSGIYYKPGSLKARFATEGNRRIVEFCQKYRIPYEQCGKVIVATAEAERPLLHTLYERGIANGLTLRKLTPNELQEREPHVHGLEAIFVPSTGIVDYVQVLNTLARVVEEKGGEIRVGTRVEGMEEEAEFIDIGTNAGTVQTRFAINCAGLFSDRVARMTGLSLGMKIVPFRGEYYELKPEKRHLVKHLVYPVPNPAFPFLGVHFTRMVDGSVHVGPNAVLSLKREGYRKGDVNLRDSWDVLTYPAFWKIAFRYISVGLSEMVRSYSQRAFVRSIQRFIPEITADDLVPAPAGVRAQALTRDGRLVDDFIIVRSKRAVHVCNAPSPAATASLVIGEHIVSLMAESYTSHKKRVTKSV